MNRILNFMANTAVAACLGFLFGMFTTFWFGVINTHADWERTTVQRGLAQYCPTTGYWAWKGECNDS